MSFDTLSIFGGFYANRLAGTSAGALLPVDSPPEDPKKPKEGVETPAGGNATDTMATGFGYLCGYSPRPPSTPAAYLSCLLDPVLAAARMFALNPIRIGKAKIAKQDDAPDERVTWIENATKKLLTSYVEDAVWSVDFGFSVFQNVWERTEGRWNLAKVIAGRQETDSGVLVDKTTGERAGIRWNGVNLFGHKGFSVTNDRRGQQWLGRSRVEVVLETVEQWRDANNMTAKLGRKASGIVLMTGFPPGSTTTSADARKAQADAFGKMITSGAGYGSYPLLGGLTEAKLNAMPIADLVKLVQLSLWKFDKIDLGDSAPAIAALTEEKRYLDELKCLGYGVPPEAILQGMGGNRAKSESQGGSGTAMNEPVSQNVYRAFNEGPVNSLLELNFGPDARDTVWWEPEPLEDAQSVFDRLILSTVAATPEGMNYLVENFDLDAIAMRNGLPKRDKPGPTDGPMQMKQRFDLATAAGQAGVSHREQLRIAGYDAAMADRIMGEIAIEDVEKQMTAPAKGATTA